MLIDFSRLVVLAFGGRSRQLVCHIECLLLMRAKTARNVYSIDGTGLAPPLLHAEHVFLRNEKFEQKE